MFIAVGTQSLGVFELISSDIGLLDSNRNTCCQVMQQLFICLHIHIDFFSLSVLQTERLAIVG